MSDETSSSNQQSYQHTASSESSPDDNQCRYCGGPLLGGRGLCANSCSQSLLESMPLPHSSSTSQTSNFTGRQTQSNTNASTQMEEPHSEGEFLTFCLSLLPTFRFR